ncbi:TetR/AcrR family transcriptional regulator [Brevibacterium casei]|uniref:TetR/AcrR family transcriptional regulator n=1 Tax=Brevibacterium casei TaxID=33889 RepID=UPI00223A9FE2|nr:TetR/AcrR family transcriptional regulator [Brevibacterium casei]MCT1766971.1 TetR/AcrR family transcriptional regulator [Brevibacterium casei]MCT2183379.1 TetR/AcrR family transcriptional regulator [Brevibacterium casei]
MADATAKTPRQRAREETEARIVEIGNRMLDEDGVDLLSLRAIARELGIVSSAVYRYVRTRDELLTILIADAFISLADAVDTALEQERSVEALGLAMLSWSRRYPQRWALIYGTPIAAYQAPREVTVEPGTRVMATLVQLVAAAESGDRAGSDSGDQAGSDSGDQVETDSGTVPGADAGSRQPAAAASPELSPGIARLAAELETLGLDVGPKGTIAAITAWVSIVGLISSLRFGQFGPGFDDVEDDLMTSVVRQLGW